MGGLAAGLLLPAGGGRKDSFSWLHGWLYLKGPGGKGGEAAIRTTYEPITYDLACLT